jgi:hypothetical protein
MMVIFELGLKCYIEYWQEENTDEIEKEETIEEIEMGERRVQTWTKILELKYF